jgi:hypothetical protein
MKLETSFSMTLNCRAITIVFYRANIMQAEIVTVDNNFRCNVHALRVISLDSLSAAYDECMTCLGVCCQAYQILKHHSWG